jgi:hypothetical protein
MMKTNTTLPGDTIGDRITQTGVQQHTRDILHRARRAAAELKHGHLFKLRAVTKT